MTQSTLVARLLRSFWDSAGRAALHFGDRSWTYAELDRLSDDLVRGLLRRGTGRGDRVAFLLPNSPELVLLNLACLKAGIIAVPMNVRMKGPEFAYVLNHAEAKLCVAHADLYPTLEGVRHDLGHVQGFFIVGPDTFAATEAFANLPHDAGPAPALPTADTDVAAILYTSGTTARPKGVTHSHGGLSATTRNLHGSRSPGPR